MNNNNGCGGALTAATATTVATNIVTDVPGATSSRGATAQHVIMQVESNPVESQVSSRRVRKQHAPRRSALQ